MPVVACEDTRRTGMLIKLLQEKYGAASSKKFISVRDWNEAKMADRILGELVNQDVALVSDAGTPLISDPGYKIVRAARAVGFTVLPIPGPNAAIAALSTAGLPTNKFIFLGFLGKKWQLFPGYTHVIYENPNRADRTCRTIRTRYVDATMVIAQELTKIHESVEEYHDDIKFKGEVTLLVWLPDGKVGEKIAADHGNRDGDGQEGEDSGRNVG